ncbi:purine permease [Gordonia sp. TBRC 11910]|uniref:Purine permease n=1 Tax=Gordonia asplenii TaxID=2725283 RepID=A0A848KTB1_9ACTN|nr:nucleobase:cation symporter-2 family protein [Gordonia asplenii]NMN99742.1 purine permease [Gordonia asplenii]
MTRHKSDASPRPEDERLPLGTTFTFGLQHVLTMYGGIIAVPLIMGTAAHLNSTDIALLITSCLFVGGFATLLQTIGIPFFGSQLPLVQGVSFAAVSTMLTIVNTGGGLPGVFGAIIVAAVFGVVVAPFFAMILHLFPPVVTGTIITTIGLTLVPVAGGWVMGGQGSPGFGSVSNIGLAAFTLLVVMLLSKIGSGIISRLSILIGMIVGTIFAAIIGKADFSKVFDGPIFAFPTPFAFGMPTFNVAAILSMIIVVLVIMTETTADIIAVGEVVGAKVDAKRVAAGLRADMAASAISPIFNSFTQSAFAQNVGLVAVTKVKGRFVVAAGGLILVLLGVLPVLGRVVAAVPMPVLGGVGIVLFGTVTASGIRTLSKVDYVDNMNLIIVATSLTFGVLPVAVPKIYDQFPDWFEVIFGSGISSAAIMAVLLNLLFNRLKLGTPKTPSVFAASPTRYVRRDVLAALETGDRVEDGKLVDCDGVEIPVIDDDTASAPPDTSARDDETGT